VPLFNRYYDDYRRYCDFLCVYIAEAHASDTWPLGDSVSVVASHQSLEDRLACARKLVELGLELPLVVDTMADSFCGQYASWPERFYIIYQGRLAFVAQPKFAAYRPIELRMWIEAYLSQLGSTATGSKSKAPSSSRQAGQQRQGVQQRPAKAGGLMDLDEFSFAREELATLEKDYEEMGIETAMCEYNGICSLCGYEGYADWFGDEGAEVCYDCAEAEGLFESEEDE